MPGFANASFAANSTIPVSTNTSTSEASQFSFIIPYDQTQACDIYGALCQTGSITVGVNLTSKTSTTVLPCSSYLTAQSSFLASEFDEQPGNVAFEDGSQSIAWWASFGRSPECRSFARAFDIGQYTASNCGSGNTSVYPIDTREANPLQIPPAVSRYSSPARYLTCCGNCSLGIPEVRLYYFPDGTTTQCHNNQTSNSTSVLSAGDLRKRVQSLVGDGGIAVVSGHTLYARPLCVPPACKPNVECSTSPSVYLQVVGTATVNDQCGGTIGPVLTDPIITLAPGQLSTWRPPPPGQFDWDNFTIGEGWQDWSTVAAVGDPGMLYPLDVKDLACPTWGLGRSTEADGTVVTTIGPPFLPLIGPMMQAFALDPIWSALCTGMLTGPFAEITFEIFDPPSALTPAMAMVPASDRNPATAPHPSDAGPTTTPDPQVPGPTGIASPASSPVLAPALPTNSGDPTDNSVGVPPSPSLPEPSKSPDPPSDGTLLPPGSPVVDPDAQSPSSAPASAMTRIADPNVPSSVDSNTGLGDPQSPVVGATASAEPAEQNGDGSAQQTQGIGAIIYNALGKSEGGATDSNDRINTLTMPSSGEQNVNIPGGSQVMSVEASNIVLGGTTYSAGGPVMTLSDSIFTIIPQPEPLDSASVANNDPNNNMSPESDPLTVAGQPVVINPSDPAPSNAIISPNDPVQTLAGTIISQQQSAASVTEDNGPSLPPVALNPDPATGNPVSAGGQTSTPAISALSIAGTTISAGGPAITVSGTIISLQPSGTLIMGSSTVDLSMTGSGAALPPDPGVPPSTTYEIDGLGVQVQSQSSFAVVDGATISAGAPGVTVLGNLVSLESGGNTLDVGTARFAMPTGAAAASEGGYQSSDLAASTYDVDGFSVQAQLQSSLAVVDGVTLTPGGLGVTISGNIVSLEPGGNTLDVGTGRFAMPTAAVNATASVQAFQGGQRKSFQVPSILIFGTLGCLMSVI